MDTEDAAHILDLLAQGIDPCSGEVVPEDHVLNSPAVIRALFLAIRALAGQSNPKDLERPKKVKPPQAGKPWTEEESERLLAAFDEGIVLDNIARSHERSMGAIAARLVKMGRIDERSEVYQRENKV